MIHFTFIIFGVLLGGRNAIQRDPDTTREHICTLLCSSNRLNIPSQSNTHIISFYRYKIASSYRHFKTIKNLEPKKQIHLFSELGWGTQLWNTDPIKKLGNVNKKEPITGAFSWDVQLSPFRTIPAGILNSPTSGPGHGVPAPALTKLELSFLRSLRKLL